MKNMQEMANSPWEQNNLSKEEYVRGIQELEEAANKHDNDPEPDKLQISKSRTKSGMMRLPSIVNQQT